MAYQNMIRNKARFFTTVLSMTLSILLVMANSYFISFHDPTSLIRHKFYWNSDYYIQAGSTEGVGFTDEEIYRLERVPGIAKVLPTRYSLGYGYVAKDKTSDKYAAYLEQQQLGEGAPPGREEVYTVHTKLYGYPGDILAQASAYTTHGRIDSSALASGEEVLLVETEDNPKSLLKPGDFIELGLQKRASNGSHQKIYPPNTKKVKIGAIVSDFPAFERYAGLRIIAHESFYTTFTGEALPKKVDITIEPGANRANIEAELDALAGQAGTSFSSFEAQKQSVAGEIKQITDMLFGFIFIITLIGLFSMINTITTNLLVRVREFGVLRAIGMTDRQLRTMIQQEGLMYGLISSVWGVGLSMLLTYLAFIFVNRSMPGLIPAWELPWKPAAAVSIGTMAICLLATLLPLGRIRRTSIIDSIRSID